MRLGAEKPPPSVSVVCYFVFTSRKVCVYKPEQRLRDAHFCAFSIIFHGRRWSDCVRLKNILCWWVSHDDLSACFNFVLVRQRGEKRRVNVAWPRAHLRRPGIYPGCGLFTIFVSRYTWVVNMRILPEAGSTLW
jgi:hypothetical protein